MKFFTNKKFLFKLIATLCVCLTLFNFCTVPKANAEGGFVSKVGGVLLDPICSLLMALGDGMMETMQKAVMGTSATVIFDNPTEGWWLTTLKNIAIVLTIVVVVVATGLVTLPALLTAAAGIAAKVAIGGFIVDRLTDGGVTTALSAVSADFFGETIVLPTYTIGPEEIFAGRILLFDANIFNPKEVKVQEEVDADGEKVKTYYYEKNGKNIPTSVNNAAQELKGTISKWYYVIRNIAILGLMLVLVYVGIRMLISSIASEKAKYKQMLSDWVIALCLVFLMQYIMVFANSFVEGVTDIFSSLADGNTHISIIKEPSNKLIESVKDINEDYVDEGKNIILWPTNLMGQIRLAAQQSDGTSGYIGFTICYFVLVLFTVFFAFTYAKRLLYLLFLTVIAPFVALTYPLDKIRDGQAQAFNVWLKEYMVNLLIQPFHLLLYIIFVSMAFDLAGTNIIYSLVVLGFMIPAEKFLRSMFGFNKATSPGFLAGPAGAAMTISAIQSLAKFAGKGPGAKAANGKGSNGSGGQVKEKIRKADPGNTTDSIMRAAVAEGNNNNSQETIENRRNVSNNQMLEDADRNIENDETQTNASSNHRLIEAPSEADLLREELNNADYNDIYMNPDKYEDKINRLDELEAGEEATEDFEPIVNQEQNESIVPEQNQHQDEETTRFTPGIRGYIKARAELFKNDNLNKDRIGELARGGLKKATTLGIGATGAMIGVASGIASGSPADAFKYGTAGAYAGSSIGQGFVNKTGTKVQNAEIRHEETLKKQYGPDEYKRRKHDELDEEFMKNSEIRKKYALEFGTKNDDELNEIMTDAKEYRKYGITDDETIIKAMSINKNDRIDKMSIAAAKLSASAKSEKDLDTTLKRFGKTPGVTGKQIEEMERRIRKINRSTLN